MIGNNERFHFLIENLIFVEAYLKAHPESQELIRNWITQGRLEVGATWTEIGQTLQIGEDLVRNLLYGRSYSEEILGNCSLTVCLGDHLGWTPQYPQIMKKCQIDQVVGNGPGLGDASVMYWQGLDGTKVKVWQNQIDNKLLWESLHGDMGSQREYWCKVECEFERSVVTPPILWGADFTQISEEILIGLEEFLEAKDLELTFGTPSEYFRKIGSSGELPVKVGEISPNLPLRESLSPEVVGLNIPAVYGLLRAEQIASTAVSLCNFIYPSQKLEEAWLHQLEAMDSKDRGTGADEAQEKKILSQKMVIWTALDVCRSSERLIAEQVDAGDGPPGTVPIVVFNPSSWERTDVITAHVIFYGEDHPTDFSRYEGYRIVNRKGDIVPFQEVFGRQVVTAEVKIVFVAETVPPGGYVTYYLIPNNSNQQQLMIEAPGMMTPEFPEPIFVLEDVKELVSEPFRGVRIGRRFTHKFYHLEVDEITGRITVIDRRTDRLLVDGMHLIGREETMREGLDQYDYTGRTFEADLERVDLEESGEVRAVLLLTGQILSSSFEERVFLYQDLDRIDVEVCLRWQDEKPVRIQMVFPLANEDLKIHYGVPYGSRQLDESRPQGEPDIGAYVKQRACQGWIAVDDDDGGVVLSANRREFEFESKEIRSDLLRSSIDPSSYSYRKMWRSYPDSCNAKYAIRGYLGDFRSELAHRDGWTLNQPMSSQSIYDTVSKRSLPDKLSFVSLESPGLVTTAFKLAQDGKGFILRVYEALGQSCETRLITCLNLFSVQETDMLEQFIRDLDPNAVRFYPFEIKTVRIVFEEEI